MFGIYSLLVLFVFLPLSISAGIRLAKGAPLNRFQINLFINPDVVEKALGQHYMRAWWAFWAFFFVMAIVSGYWGSAVVFGLYVWSRLRVMKLLRRSPAVVAETN